MKPDYLSLSKIFGPDARLTVPLFQRQYVWSRDEQWAPLWDDVAALADRVSAASSAEKPAGHFLGTAVLEQAPNAVGTLQIRDVIDGQQRLTTLQILLKAAEHAIAEDHGACVDDAPEKRKLAFALRLVANLTANSAYGSDEEKYKVWPTNDDRAAFRLVMDSASYDEAASVNTRMAEAYKFFAHQIRGWIGAEGTTARISALATALNDHLRLIVLDLDGTDEPQAIFETLNARGTPLLPADLIKNRLLWEATRQKLELQSLYEKYWRPFDKEPTFWRAKVGSGHAARPTVDVLLQHWLTRRTLEAVPVKHLYARFLTYLAGEASRSLDSLAPVEAILSDIQDDAENYRRLVAPAGMSRFAEFVRRLARLNIVVFAPLLLAVMRRPGVGPSELDDLAPILESYLVRRMVCGAQTRGYGALVLKLIEAVESSAVGAPVALLIRAKLEEEDGTQAWPGDDQFWTHWSTRQFYGYLKRDRVLMVLQAIEREQQAGAKFSEPIVTYDFSQLEIEHILPQAWEAEWGAPVAPMTHADRNSKLHGIGNLTLVKGSLNSSLSNAAWAYPASGNGGARTGKHATLEAYSYLTLNRNLVRGYPTRWDEECMACRAKELFKVACKIWPAPSAHPAATDVAPGPIAAIPALG